MALTERKRWVHTRGATIRSGWVLADDPDYTIEHRRDERGVYPDDFLLLHRGELIHRFDALRDAKTWGSELHMMRPYYTA